MVGDIPRQTHKTVCDIGCYARLTYTSSSSTGGGGGGGVGVGVGLRGTRISELDTNETGDLDWGAESVASRLEHLLDSLFLVVLPRDQENLVL